MSAPEWGVTWFKSLSCCLWEGEQLTTEALTTEALVGLIPLLPGSYCISNKGSSDPLALQAAGESWTSHAFLRVIH